MKKTYKRSNISLFFRNAYRALNRAARLIPVVDKKLDEAEAHIRAKAETIISLLIATVRFYGSFAQVATRTALIILGAGKAIRTELGRVKAAQETLTALGKELQPEKATKPAKAEKAVVTEVPVTPRKKRPYRISPEGRAAQIAGLHASIARRKAAEGSHNRPPVMSESVFKASSNSSPVCTAADCKLCDKPCTARQVPA